MSHGQVSIAHIVSSTMLTRCIFLFPQTVLIGPEDEPEDSGQQVYLCQLKEALNPGEYHTLRTDWLSYQKCSMNVDGIYKHVKLMLRGSR